jgi:hypothetical protein
MPTELSMVGAPVVARPTGSASAEPRVATADPAGARVPAVERLAPRAVEPSQALDRASQAAARALFRDHDVEVTSFQDEGTGRIVYRIADKASGQVLHQSPPDALLRFFASARRSLERPLLAVEA